MRTVDDRLVVRVHRHTTMCHHRATTTMPVIVRVRYGSSFWVQAMWEVMGNLSVPFPSLEKPSSMS
jgi:hypothetical protein